MFKKKQIEITYRKFGVEKRQWLVNLYKKNPILYLDEARDLFMRNFKISISCSSVNLILHEAGLSWKTLERRAMQIRSDDVYRFYVEMSQISWFPQNLVFLDEVSIDNRALQRTKGYGPVGQRVLFRGEFTRKARVSLLCFLGYNGILESYSVDGTFTRATFFKFCKDFALKKDTPVRTYPGVNSIWILDGAMIHCDKNIIDYLRTLGIIVIFLPAYAPQLNPIEIVFGLIKKYLQRNHKDQSSSRGIQMELAEAINKFTNKSMENLYRKCGYIDGKFNPGKGFASSKELR